MTTYATTDTVYKSAQRYLTPGKRYVVTEDDGKSFNLVDDEGDTIRCRWEDCAYLGGAGWTRIEEPATTEERLAALEAQMQQVTAVFAAVTDVLRDMTGRAALQPAFGKQEPEA